MTDSPHSANCVSSEWNSERSLDNWLRSINTQIMRTKCLSKSTALLYLRYQSMNIKDKIVTLLKSLQKVQQIGRRARSATLQTRITFVIRELFERNLVYSQNMTFWCEPTPLECFAQIINVPRGRHSKFINRIKRRLKAIGPDDDIQRE